MASRVETKSSILLIGPTRFPVKRCWRKRWRALLDIAVHYGGCDHANRSWLRGEDVGNIIRALLQKCDYDVQKAQRGDCLH